jgi:hypothetical protein
MRLTQDKVNKLSNLSTQALADLQEVEFLEPYDDVRQMIRGILEGLLAEEERLDAQARQKIESQQRTILEGSAEWQILYNKYYDEAVRKLGI